MHEPVFVQAASDPTIVTGRSLADRLYEGMVFLKRLAQAEGRSTPEIG